MTRRPEQLATAVADAGATAVAAAEATDVAEGLQRRWCLWCRGELSATQERWCSKRCRQTAWRARRLTVAEYLDDSPKRLAYADPPYPGLAWMYRDQPPYAGEVDHVELLERLSKFDGWALSTSERGLRSILPHCPPGHRVCAWVKPGPAHPRTRGPHGLWEPLIVMPARLRAPGVRNYLAAKPARGGESNLIGRKPIAFVAWMLSLLGASPMDELDDLFPGTGVVGHVWRQFKASQLEPRQLEKGQS